MVRRKVPPVHGFVMRDSVSESARFIELPMKRLTAAVIPRECVAQCRPPEPRLIVGTRPEERHPKPERKFGYNPVGSRNSLPPADLIDGICSDTPGNAMQAQIFRIPPVGTVEQADKSPMKRITTGYLQAAERRLKCCRYLDIPRVQPHCRSPVRLTSSKVRGDS
jgi:hypothetical protein